MHVYFIHIYNYMHFDLIWVICMTCALSNTIITWLYVWNLCLQYNVHALKYYYGMCSHTPGYHWFHSGKLLHDNGYGSWKLYHTTIYIRTIVSWKPCRSKAPKGEYTCTLKISQGVVYLDRTEEVYSEISLPFVAKRPETAHAWSRRFRIHFCQWQIGYEQLVLATLGSVS